METQFPDWLAALKAGGLGGSDAEMPVLAKGRAYGATVTLAAHTTFGNWLSGAFTMQAKASPDLDGPALATFTCTQGVPTSAGTPVRIALGDNAQTSVPDEGASGVSEMFYDMVFTPNGGVAHTIIGGRIPLASGVTA